MTEYKYKTSQENYDETLAEAYTMTIAELESALHDRLAMHKWAVDAYEKVLLEKRGGQ